MKFRFPTFLVGGAVRDELMGMKSKDLDFVVVCPSFADMETMLLEQGCKIFQSRPEFLVSRALHPKLGAVDFAVARTDGEYKDGRRPESTGIASNVEEDLARRDFTINAIAKNVETGEIIDPFGGAKDIRLRTIRAVGDPKKRLEEDKLRAFRALRFSVTKGFMIDSLLTLSIQSLTPGDFHAVSNERIKDELEKMFAHNPIISMIILLRFHFLSKLAFEDRGISLIPSLKKR
jgi:tRNA nucleotidyltransferase (CCA-adding enzyme)